MVAGLLLCGRKVAGLLFFAWDRVKESGNKNGIHLMGGYHFSFGIGVTTNGGRRVGEPRRADIC